MNGGTTNLSASYLKKGKIMKKVNKKLKISDIVINILLVLSFVILGLSIYTTIKYKENPQDAYLFGYKPVLVLTGSMEPTLKEKGICIVKKVTYDEVDIDDILMYTIDEKTITHRIISKTEEGIRTKGDNNNVQDAYLLGEENVKAKVVAIFNFTAPIINDFEGGYMGYVRWIGFPIFVLVVIFTVKKVVKNILKNDIAKNKTEENKTEKDKNDEKEIES